MTARSEGLTVFVRVRPPILKEVKEQFAVHCRGTQSLTVTSESKETTCSYDHVFNDVSEQSQVFEKVKPLLVDVLSGINSCIFAYGQTSAGKSYTMIGPNGGQDILRCDKNEWGVLPRASEFLLGYLNEKAKEGVLTYEVKASFLQIYNENLYDLLRDSGPMMDDRLTINSANDEDLKIREIAPPKNKKSVDTINEVFVSGLSEYRVQTSDDILRILAVGTSNRATRSTDFNLTSSRSHAILQLTFSIESHLPSGQTLISKSKLNLVDLAGSEKIPYTTDTNNQKHMKELTAINKSLSCLGNVISALTSSNRSHIPYRDSKLTRILQDSLSGNTRTILIACVAPTVLHTSESFSTLQFADRAKNVMLSVKANTLVDDKVLLAKANAEISRLKALLTHALKQLEQKANSESNNGGEIERLLNENEDLRRENASLLKRCMHTDSQTSIASHSVTSYEGRERERDQSRHGGRELRSRRESSVSHTPSKNTPQVTPRKKKSSVQSMRENSKLLDTKQLESKIKKTQYEAFSDFSGPTRAASQKGGKNKIPTSQGKAFGRHLEVHKDKDTDGGSEGEYESPPKRGSNKNKQSNLKPNSDGVFDILDSYSRNDGDKDKESRLRSNLYKAINDRQVEELNLRLAAANMKVAEEDLKYREETDIESSINTLLGLKKSNKAAGSFNKPGIPSIVEEPENSPQKPSMEKQYRQFDNGITGDPYVRNNNSNSYNTNVNNNNGSALDLHGLASPQTNSTGVMELNERNLQSHNNSRATSSNNNIPNNVNSQNQNYGYNQPYNQQFNNQSGLSINTGGINNQQLPPFHQQPNGNNSFGMSPAAPQYNRGISGISASPNPGYDSSRQLAPPHSASSNLSGMTSASKFDQFAPSNRVYLKNKNPTGPTSRGTSDEQSGYMSPAGTNTGLHNKMYNGNHHHFPTASVPLKAAAHTASILAMAINNNHHPSGMEMVYPGNQAAHSGNHKAVNLFYTKQDVGTPIQMFSFRNNTWDRVDIIDFDENKRLHKCRYIDGSMQWLELSKKPIREYRE